MDSDSRAGKVADEPFPDTKGPVGVRVQESTAPDWDTLLGSLNRLMSERDVLVRRLAEVDELIKEVMRQGSQH